MSAVAFCGLDFGTSNSTLGLMRQGVPELVALEGNDETLPSAIFFDFAAHRPLIGRAAIAAYSEGVEGRLMRSLKSVLGTDLVDQETLLARNRISFRAVIGQLVGAIKARAETVADEALDAVVHGRPVHFVDGDAAADAHAENALAEIARAAGFKHVSFQYEPIAAALDYERQVTQEEIALIADIGGGTSDFSIVRLGPVRSRAADRAGDILANDGIRIGGTDFDRLLSLRRIMPSLGYGSPMRRPGLLAPNGYFTDLSTWSRINFLYAPKVRAELRDVLRESARPDLISRLIRVVDEHWGHRLAITVERAKIVLSGRDAYDVDLGWIESGWLQPIARAEMENATDELVRGIVGSLRGCLAAAGLQASDVDAVFLTGGSTLLPHVRRAILAAIPEAAVVDGDKFGSVGLGLTLEAARRYGRA
jgi:hypothetical chaperone protein